MFTTNTMELLLAKLPKAPKEAHLAPGITNKLLSVFVLCYVGCEVFLHSTGCEISFNGVIFIRGWRDMQTNMWSISLLDEVLSNIIPDDSDGAMMPDLVSIHITEGFSNNIHECETTSQLI